MTDFTLEGRVAIVTGAGRGLGRSHALALANAGASIVVNDLGASLSGEGASTLAAEEVVAEIVAAGGKAVADTTDITTPEGGAALVAKAVDTFGGIDILVNNAGILRDRSAHKMTSQDVDPVLEVHLWGAFNVTLPAYAHMREAGYGRIIMTSSASGLMGNFGQLNYGAAKAALLGFVKVLSIEGANRGVHVNAISPVASTRMTEAEFGDLAGLFPPDFVSQLVLYLASERCGVSGEIFSVGGGQIARIFVGLTEGIFRPEGFFSPQEIEAALPEIMNVSNHSVPRSLTDEWEKIMRLHKIPATRG